MITGIGATGCIGIIIILLQRYCMVATILGTGVIVGHSQCAGRGTIRSIITMAIRGDGAERRIQQFTPAGRRRGMIRGTDILIMVMVTVGGMDMAEARVVTARRARLG